MTVSLWPSARAHHWILSVGSAALLVLAVPASAEHALDEQNTIDIVRRFGPSVVAVTVTIEGQPVDPLQNVPPELRPFFPRFGVPGGTDEPGTYTERAAGSGFVATDEGLLVTNFHVVSEALEPGKVTLRQGATITVRFPGDELDRPVTVLGADQSYDLALLRLQDPESRPANAIAIPVGDSDTVEVGQKAIAIGNPFGLQSTVTSGIVSAVNRRAPSAGSGIPIDFVQTDAAVNPGNSGGPLLDSSGRLIGVNDAILAPNGTFVGVGLAIPSNLLKIRLADLQAGGYLAKAQLGVQVLDMAAYPAEVRTLLKLPENGVMIVSVAENGPAESAGLHGAEYTLTASGQQWPAGGDIVIEADGTRIASGGDLQDVGLATKKDQTVRLVYLRDGQRRQATVRPDILVPADD
ncbi:trypsin-like peptidase domain-containing protein [Arhodomonas aquaeolei]|uniref:S1C family serine protease n=1 Tax=Arhodomonas aquaeolei TaxID=2369 RepID=UPI002167D6CF|nr:trypsin-like peptidase domain-containing protein [Arhodomonas aquaeolei]MCS4504447.1 trypsin-like peptidase domain-containing protein [Arhodomonas aquaeolei]